MRCDDLNKRLVLLAVFFFLLFSAPQFLRNYVYGGTIIGTTSYYHVRMAEMISKNQLYDPLSFGGRFYTYPPGFHLLLSFLLPIKDFLLPLFGIGGIILAYYFARQLGLSDEESLFSAALLGLIPGYVYLSGHLNPRLPAILCLIASYYFLMRKEPEAKYYASVFYAFSLITHPFAATVGGIMAFLLFWRNKKRVLVSYSLSASLFILAWLLPLVMSHGLPSRVDFYTVYIELKSGIQYFVFEARVVSDTIGAFTWLMALYSAFKFKTKQVNFLKLWLFLGIVVSLSIGNRLNEMLYFPIAMLAAKTFVTSWHKFLDTLHLTYFVQDLKFWTALFFIYSSIIGILAAGALLYFPPSPAEYHAMEWIKDNTPKNAVIMGYWQDGHWISGIAERKNVIDAYAEYGPNVDERYQDMLNVMEGTDLDRALNSLKKYNVSYIYYPLINTIYCDGFTSLTKYSYFKLVFHEDHKFVYKVDYSGKSQPFDLCKNYVNNTL